MSGVHKFLKTLDPARVIWSKVRTWEPTFLYVMGGKKGQYDAENIRRHRRKFRRQGERPPGIMHPSSASDRCTGTFCSLSIYALGGTSSVLLCSNLLYYLLCRYCSWLDSYCSGCWFTILYKLLNLCIVEWGMVSRLWIMSRERYPIFSNLIRTRI